MHEFIILKFVGVAPDKIGPLDAFVKSEKSRISVGVEAEISSDGKSITFFRRGNQTTDCIRIIASERDPIHETYTVKLALIAKFRCKRYQKTDGAIEEADAYHEFVIRTPLRVIVGLTEILGQFPENESVDTISLR